MTNTDKNIFKEICQSLEGINTIERLEAARTGARDRAEVFKDLGVELTDAHDD